MIDEPKRAEKLIEALDGYKADFTDVVSAADFQPKQAEIFLISFNEKSIEMAALVRKTVRVAFGKDRIRFTDLVRFDAVKLDRIETLLSKRIKQHFSRAMSGKTVRLPHKTWIEVWEAVKRERPSKADEFDHLERLRLERSAIVTGPHAATMAHEKDAAMLALKLAGLEFLELLKRISPEEELSLFKGIKSANLTEDQMIKHDASIFADWDLVERTRVGEAIFRSGSRVVTIMDVNRTSIEKTLGVDLLYYVRPSQTFLMVQYKRMIKESDGKFGYRPDDRCHNELDRMRSYLADNPDEWDSSPNSFRLSPMPFFIKLCPQATYNPTSERLLSGMYFPLDLWESMCASEEIRGPKGGIRVTYENTPTRLNTTEFITLVQTGMFGSRGATTTNLRQLVRTNVEMDHSVVIAEVDTDTSMGMSNEADREGPEIE